MKNLANILTIARLVLLPVIILLFFIPAAWAAWACLALYTAGAVTDWLDGWVARRFNQISDFGRFLDPIADKIFVVAILIMLVAVDRIDGIWVLAVIVILVREFLVAGLREFLGPKGITVHVTGLAKWKTAIQMIATGILIVGPFVGGPALLPGPELTWLHFTGLLGLSVAAALTAITGWNYLKTGWAHIKG